MDVDRQVAEELKTLRAQGLSLESALEKMLDESRNLLPLIKAIRDVEGVSLRKASDILWACWERRFPEG